MISNTVIALAPTNSASEPPMSPEAKTKKEPHFKEAKLQYKFLSFFRSKRKQSPTFRTFYYVNIYIYSTAIILKSFNRSILKQEKFTYSKDASCHKPLAG